MNLAVWLLIVASLVIIGSVVGTLIGKRVRRRRRANLAAIQAATAANVKAGAQAKLLEWIMAIEAAKTDLAISVINSSSVWSTYEADPERQQAARDKYYGARKRLNSIEFYENKVKVAETPGDRAMLVIEAHNNDYDYGLALGLADGMTAGEFLVQQLRATFERFKAGDQVAKIDYERVMDTYRLDRICKDLNIDQLTFPAEWEDAVTQHVRTPVVNDFRLTPRLSSSEVRAQAAEAIAARDRRKAKLVLAYCEVREEVTGYGSSRSRQVMQPYLAAIGDVMLAQLSMLAHEPQRFAQYLQSFAISLQKP